jgi:DNA-binding transcriptional LysR family regulator
MLPWVTYDETMAHLPQARWIAATAVRSHHRIAAVHVNDAEALLEAVTAGLGRSLLPCVIADDDARLRRIGGKRRAPALSRELWLLRRSELATLGRIEAVVKWIEQIVPH